MRFLFCSLFSFFLGFSVFFSSVGYGAQPPEPPGAIHSFTKIFTEIPDTFYLIGKTAFAKESFDDWLLLFYLTHQTYLYDEEMLLEAQRMGRKWGLGNDDNTKTMLEVGGMDIFRGPTDLGSALYFLGDGWLHSAIAGSFYLFGGDKGYQVFCQLAHGMFVSMLINQTGKRTTGRESPFVRTRRRGEWRPVPNPATYGNATPKYDAYPSGHIMTSTLIFTVIAENYPDYASWIYSLEVVWLTALGFQMMNNGVHWASDYPLGIAMGYLTGKVASRSANPNPEETAWRFYPTFNDTHQGMGVEFKF